MSTQRETDAEAGKERFVPKAHERVSETPDSSLASVASDDDRLDWLARQAGTDVCVWCGARKSVPDIDACERERENPDGTREGRCCE